jgi:hypothetical protein
MCDNFNHAFRRRMVSASMSQRFERDLHCEVLLLSLSYVSDIGRRIVTLAHNMILQVIIDQYVDYLSTG